VTASEKSPERVARELADALAERGLDYALSGAVAFAFWGVPRATVDVDVGLYVGRDKADLVADAVESVGATLDREGLRRCFETGGVQHAWCGPVRIDLFPPSIEFEQESFRTRLRVVLEGREVWVVSAEALCVFKLMYFRSKDIPDLERIVAVQGAGLDCGYVRRWVAEMMGEDDVRVRKWDDIVRDFR